MYYMLSMIYTRGIIIYIKQRRNVLLLWWRNDARMAQNTTSSGIAQYDFNDGLEWCECAVWNIISRHRLILIQCTNTIQ